MALILVLCISVLSVFGCKTKITVLTASTVLVQSITDSNVLSKKTEQESKLLTASKGTAAEFASSKNANDFWDWIKKNINAISAQSGAKGTLYRQTLGREVILNMKV